MKKQISILYAIYQEYGEETFFKRLFKIYNIEIPITNHKIIIFLPENIIIKDEEKNITYTISFQEEYYKFIKDFNDYTFEVSYDYNHNIFRKTFLFKTSDNKILAIDEIDEENIKNRRILKTTLEDKNLINGEYEKEHLSLVKPNAEENYEFINCPNSTNIKKVLRMPNCIYYYSYDSKTIYPEIKDTFHIIEVGSSTNTPSLNFYGRKRNNNEVLLNCLRNKMPSIIIRGSLLIPNNTNKTFYKISILKSKEGITIHYISTNLNGNIQNQKIVAIPILKDGELSVHELDNIKQAIINNIYDEIQKDFPSNCIITDIERELESIKHELLVSQRKVLKQVDAIDFKLNQYKDIEHLAFDVYENLSEYEKFIASKLRISPDSPNQSLKKEK